MTEQERAREIIEEGKAAYSDGLSISESPYLDPSEEHDWWLKGYYREKELSCNSAKSAFEAAGNKQ